MEDKQLLELAAKAAGLSLLIGPDGATYIGDPIRRWNPLTDDGDALRLAIKLHINVFIYADETSTATGGVVAKNWGSVAANTRRAIVRDAAEQGKGM